MRVLNVLVENAVYDGLNIKILYLSLSQIQILVTLCVLNFNTLRPRQNGRHFPDAIFKCIFLNRNIRILIIISLKFVPQGSINNTPALVQTMAWRQPVDKPLSEPMLFSLLTHNCVTRPQWVKIYYNMVRWISAPGTMHFCPQYDTFWPCRLFTLLQFCKHPPSKISMKLRWVSSVN